MAGLGRSSVQSEAMFTYRDIWITYSRKSEGTAAPKTATDYYYVLECS